MDTVAASSEYLDPPHLRQTMSTSGRNWTSRVICPVPSHSGHLRRPVLYEKSPAPYPAAFASAPRANLRRRSSRTPLYVATVDLTFVPIGVASMTFTRVTHPASSDST